MRKNLLLTTALVGVAFAFPAMAGDTQNPPADETITHEAIYTNETGTTVADGTVFEGLKQESADSQNAGAVTVNTQGSIVIGNDVKFLGNNSVAAGGAMKALSGFEIGNNVTFEGNTSEKGGAALYIRQSPNTGATDPVASTTAKIGDGAKFIDNHASDSWHGGAIAVEYAPEGLTIGKNALFEKNSGGHGGAIGLWVSGNDNITDKVASVLKIGDGAQFIGNEAKNIKGENPDGYDGRGGALFINDGAQAELGTATFEGNTAKEWGGAIYVGSNILPDLPEGSTNSLKLGKSTFTGNTAVSGGAIFVDAVAGEAGQSVVEIASGSEFINNKADGGTGGAIYNRGIIAPLDNVTFKGNTAENGGGAITNSSGTIEAITNSLFENNSSTRTGGAIYNNGKGTTNAIIGLISNTTFKNNSTTTNGGAIFNGGSTKSTITLVNTTFEGNNADTGGAITSSGIMNISNSTFSNNWAKTQGGALNVDGEVNFSGENTFTNNKIASSAEEFETSTTYSDIHLQKASSAIDVSGTLNLDGGISGEGDVTFDNVTVNITENTTFEDENKISYDYVGENNLGLIVNKGEESATFNLANLKIASEEDAEGFNLVDNALYNFSEGEEENTLVAEQKSADEVASSLGATGSQAAAIQAALFSEGESDNEAFNGFTEALNSGLQSADKAQVAAAKAATEMLTADANPVVRTVETDIHNMVFSAVSDELNGEGGAIAEGKSSGDTFKQVKAWIRGLFNRADHESTSKASGFDADIYGVAMGIDKQINNAVKLGVGYAYSQADISSGIRDTDVDTHTAILYGQYRPANWYINTVVAYNWSDYDEKKAALGYSADASYDVESLGIQSMYGYETKLGEYDLTPEAGLRYAHISRDGYTDALGTSVASDDSDILTAVVGAKVAKDYTIGCNTIVRPELKAAVTYDLFDDGNNSYVSLANGSAYRVNGEKLDRLGFEFGAKVATEVSDNLEISAGWEGRFREDYQDHTAMLNAKYSF